jgi:hypothetical protein
MLYRTVADRRNVRVRAANAALDLLRRTVLGLPGANELQETFWKKGK